jgi:hypothetical protein
MPAAAAAATCVLPFMSFFLSCLTWMSVTNGPP